MRRAGMMAYLWKEQVLLKDWGRHAEAVSAWVVRHTQERAREQGRPVKYLRSPKTDKAQEAQAIASQDGIREGLVAVLSCAGPCRSYGVRGNRETHRLELVCQPRQCLHFYHYLIHPRFGWMHVRLQTWFPFTVHVCLNGREWLAREMDRAGLDYARWGNCFPWISDVEKAQRLMDRQLKQDWPRLLEDLRREIHPLHEQIFASCPQAYYWTAKQSEWATDVMFDSKESLQARYPAWIHHALTTFQSPDVMRFLGQPVTLSGKVHGNFGGEIVSDVKERVEGVRIAHRAAGKGLKGYDKWSIFRVEATFNNVRGFKVCRPKGKKQGRRKAWLPLRESVTDLKRRAQVSQAATSRYLEALAQVEDGTSLGELTEKLCQPARSRGRRVRALNPWAPQDAALLQAVARGAYLPQGFRNRDLRQQLYGPCASPQEQRRRSSAVSRKLRLLRAHGLMRKVPRAHRYLLSRKGQTIILALLTARQTDVQTLTKLAVA
jgi:hypothetical protein